MYYDGIGVDKNLDKAEQLFETAAIKGISSAMQSLAKMLLDKNELLMAKIWYDRACEAGNISAQTHRRTFEEVLQAKQRAIDQCSPSTAKRAIITKDVLEPCAYDHNTLIEHANRGSVTAKKVCDALGHLKQALSVIRHRETLTENDENIFVHELSLFYRIEHIVAQNPDLEMRRKIADIVDRVLQRCSIDDESISAVSQVDEDVRICYAVLHMDSQREIALFLGPCKQKYPKSIYFLELSALVNCRLGESETALYDANNGLELEPNYPALLYYKAVALQRIGNDMCEAITACQAFLANASNDHRKVPETYYAMAGCYLIHEKDRSITADVRKMYQQGEEAEKLQLPCFPPYESNSKARIKDMLDKVSSMDTVPSVSAISNKSRLINRHRIEVILEHRTWQNTLSQQRDNSVHAVVFTTQKARVQQRTAKSLIGLKPITLREMNPMKEHVYEGYVLSATIIGEAYSWVPSIHLLIEDEHLDCKKICVYGFPEDHGEYLTGEVLRIGSKMHIINPYLRLGANDRIPVIRIEDFS